jgi:hypothetical protein
LAGIATLPNTGLPLSAWCDLEEVLVTANIEDLGTDTYALAFVDRNPFGAIYQNDYSLEEEDDSMYEMDSEMYEGEEELEEEFNLEEILRELEEEDGAVNEEEDMMNEMFDMENEAATGTEGIGEVTVDELRNIIRDELAAAGLGEEEGMEGEEEMDMDFNLGDEEGGEVEAEETETEEEGEEEGEEKEKKSKKKKSEEEELEELYSLYEAMKSKKKEKEEKMDEAKKAGTSGGVAPHKNIKSFSAAGKYSGPKVIKEEEDDIKEAMKTKMKAMMERRK